MKAEETCLETAVFLPQGEDRIFREESRFSDQQLHLRIVAHASNLSIQIVTKTNLKAPGV